MPNRFNSSLIRAEVACDVFHRTLLNIFLSLSAARSSVCGVSFSKPKKMSAMRFWCVGELEQYINIAEVKHA